MSVVPLSYNFDAMESQIKGDVAAIRDLCTLAVSRMQTHIDPVHKTGPVVFAAVTEGLEFGTYLCKNNLYMTKSPHPLRFWLTRGY